MSGGNSTITQEVHRVVADSFTSRAALPEIFFPFCLSPISGVTITWDGIGDGNPVWPSSSKYKEKCRWRIRSIPSLQ